MPIRCIFASFPNRTQPSTFPPPKHTHPPTCAAAAPARPSKRGIAARAPLFGSASVRRMRAPLLSCVPHSSASSASLSKICVYMRNCC